MIKINFNQLINLKRVGFKVNKTSLYGVLSKIHILLLVLVLVPVPFHDLSFYIYTNSDFHFQLTTFHFSHFLSLDHIAHQKRQVRFYLYKIMNLNFFFQFFFSMFSRTFPSIFLAFHWFFPFTHFAIFVHDWIGCLDLLLIFLIMDSCVLL